VRTVRFAAAAREEFLAEVAFYNEAQAGLGQRFTEAIEKATALTLAFPSVGSLLKGGTRRVVVKDFPFSVIYKPSAQGVMIYAVAHQSRRPGYWHSRIGAGG
jgi:plasmid stabilization system protein ParE